MLCLKLTPREGSEEECTVGYDGQYWFLGQESKYNDRTLERAPHLEPALLLGEDTALDAMPWLMRVAKAYKIFSEDKNEAPHKIKTLVVGRTKFILTKNYEIVIAQCSVVDEQIYTYVVHFYADEVRYLVAILNVELG